MQTTEQNGTNRIAGMEPKAVKPTKAAASKAMGVSSGLVEIPAPDLRLMSVELVGLTPLIMHKFSAKATREIIEKQMHKAKAAKGARDPEQEFTDAIHFLPGHKDRYAFPASAFKNAAVAACSHVPGVTKVVARGAFHVLGDLVEIVGTPIMREDNVRVMGKAHIRYRAEFATWSTSLRVRYNHGVMSPEQIINLMNVAGFCCGIGDWRPQRDGSMGMFQVGSAKGNA